MIELRQLRYLVLAAESGSFSRAAKRLGIKQSTLSRQLLALEKRLGIEMFERMSRGAVLTPAGETYLRTAQRVVREFAELNSWLHDTRKGQSGRLAVGFYTSFSAGNLRATLEAFTGGSEAIRIERFERDRDHLLSGLESGLIDIAIMPGEGREPLLSRRSLWSERIHVALPANNALGLADRIYWTDLRGERFRLTQRDPGPQFRQLILGKLADASHHPDIELEDISRETLLASVGIGEHITIVVEAALGLGIVGMVFREIHDRDGPTRVGFSAYWREDNANPVLKAFLAFVEARFSIPVFNF
ncbi:MAG: LysR family transcriptional regulator [Novosphingobium sp.]|uniref:LysR family transcriptional regulator n=1 Tax=Novosphingobium sp. TaxID=1874826 RepID=UPI001DEFAD66|nr:LysR family transcriptional regulator [Novosphingobium sp.]MCB2057150.1 LysR family transcriptional regulator [Novosphingobium sp.]MCP5385993.1 LysR family transcriptional regulator [Novosphingobium sp.]